VRQLPEFITFTGVDDHTSIGGMLALSRLYPIEWGVLLSRSRQGVDTRYPSWQFISGLISHHRELALSAHVCGAYAREVMEDGQIQGVDAVLGRWFRRAQVNHTEPNHASVALWAQRVRIQAIVQHRHADGFTRSHPDVALLFDASGGRGIQPEAWPIDTSGVIKGYAGGLNPDNVAHAVNEIGRTAPCYWLDMETGVRDENDRFDLERCRAVCEAVYGKSLFA
jgi:phosphoribosylanthranilate isomerase